MITRRKLQITMALTLLFAMLMSTTVASAQSVTLGGSATFRDADGSALGSNNSLVLSLTDAPTLGVGYRYEGWLVGPGGTKVSVGTYNGPIDGTWVSPTNENLAASYSQLLLTTEPVPDPDPATHGAVAFSATIASGVIEPVRGLLTASGTTATGNGIAVALHGEATIAAVHAAASQGSGVLGDLQSHAQHVSIVIDGLGTPGDGIGILAYAESAKVLAAAAKASEPGNKKVVAGADAAIAAANRIIDRAGIAKANVAALLAATSINASTEVASVNVTNMSNQMVASAAALYAAAQDTVTFVPKDGPVVEAPSAGDQLVPMIAMLALVAGVILTGGGLAMLRRRGLAAA